MARKVSITPLLAFPLSFKSSIEKNGSSSRAAVIFNAALNPSDTDYVYFYAEITTGKLHFAKTYSEFQELIRLYS